MMEMRMIAGARGLGPTAAGSTSARVGICLMEPRTAVVSLCNVFRVVTCSHTSLHGEQASINVCMPM
jgi:hypothetical protein